MSKWNQNLAKLSFILGLPVLLIAPLFCLESLYLYLGPDFTSESMMMLMQLALSLYYGLLIGFIFAIAGLILGILSLKATNNKRLSWIGIALNIIGLLCGILFIYQAGWGR